MKQRRHNQQSRAAERPAHRQPRQPHHAQQQGHTLDQAAADQQGDGSGQHAQTHRQDQPAGRRRMQTREIHARCGGWRRYLITCAGHAADHGIGRHIFDDHAARGHHRALPHPHPIQQDHAGSQPHIILDDDALVGDALGFDRQIGAGEQVVLGMKTHALADEHVGADAHAARRAHEIVIAQVRIGPHLKPAAQVGDDAACIRSR